MKQAWEFSHPRFIQGKSLEYYSANIRRRTAADFTPSHMELDSYRGEISTLREQVTRQERMLAMKDSELALARRTIEHQATELSKARAALAAYRHGAGTGPTPPAMAAAPNGHRASQLPPSSAPAQQQPHGGFKRGRTDAPPNYHSGAANHPSTMGSWSNAPSLASASFPPSFAQMGQRGGINPPLPSHDMYSGHQRSSHSQQHTHALDGPMFRAPSATDSLPDDVSLCGELSGHTPRKFSRGLRNAGMVHHAPPAPPQASALLAAGSTSAAAAVLQAAASDSFLNSPPTHKPPSGLFLRAGSVTGGGGGSITGANTPGSAMGTSGAHDIARGSAGMMGMGTGLQLTMPHNTGGPADALHTLAAAMEGASASGPSHVPLRNVRSAASWAASDDDADGVWEALDASLRGGADMGNWDDEALDRVPGGRVRLNSAGSLSHSEIVPPSSMAGSGGSGGSVYAPGNAAADTMRANALQAPPSATAVASLLAVLCMAADRKELDDASRGMLCMPQGACTTLSAVENLQDCVAGMSSVGRAHTVFRLVAEATGAQHSVAASAPAPNVSTVTAVLKQLAQDSTASKFARLSASAARARDPKQPTNAANNKALGQMQAAFPAQIVLACILPVPAVHAVLLGCVNSTV